MREIDSVEVLIIGGYSNMNNTCFADDAVLLAASEVQLQVLLQVQESTI